MTLETPVETSAAAVSTEGVMGELIEPGSAPFLIDDPQVVWVIDEGVVELFTVGLEAGQPVGSRKHCRTVDAGEAMFGMDFVGAQAQAGLLAVSRLDTRIRRISLSEIKKAGADPRTAKQVGKWLNDWVEGLAERLSRQIQPLPLIEEQLEAGARIELESGAKARALSGVLWLASECADLFFVGTGMVSLRRGQLLPVTAKTWVEPVAEGFDLEAFAVEERLADPDFWSSLDLFHDTFCRCELINRRLAVVDELNRLRSKSEYAKVAEDDALKMLASVLRKGGEGPRTDVDLESPDLLLKAMIRVGAAQGIVIEAHPELGDHQEFDERLAMIAKASGIRYRQVMLRDDWWRQDHGPILAVWEAGKQPVALLPKGPRAYELWDPETGDSRHVNEQVAADLSAAAQVLYRPFPPGPMSAFKLIKFGAYGLRGDFFNVVLMGLVLGLLGTLTPFFTGRIFDDAIPEAERSMLIQFVAALGTVALAGAGFRITQNVAVVRIQGKMDYSIQAALWDRLLNLPSGFFRDYTAGDLADRAAGINAIRGLIAQAGVAAILGALSAVFYVVMMFWYSLKLGLLAMAMSLAFVGCTFLANLLQLRLQRRELAVRGRLTGLVLQLLSGVGRLRVSGSEVHGFRAWAKGFAEQRRLSFRIGTIQNAVAVISSAYPIAASMAVFAMLSFFPSDDKSFTTGSFLAFNSAFGLFTTAMLSLGEASLSLLRAVPIYERLKPIVTTAPETDETKAYPGRLRGKIELSHVHFRYQEGPWIIKDVSISIEPGEFVAFVGSSGSGKSTLMRLMLGFEKPQKGSIYYDGQDLGNLDLRAIRQQLGVVLQDSRVLPTDIFRNIVGTSSRTEEDAWEAARNAGLDKDIRQMPMGMHTYVSEGGGGLSGGQLQRLLIARAIVDKPTIIFMDEATSALDNKTQSVVTKSLEKLQATRIVIAHRLSTIINADRICYLDQGEPVEVGTYEELMALDGLFAKLAKRQQS